MAKSQNSFMKNQRAKQKSQERAKKLERKHNKKTEPKSDIHDMSKLERPESLGFLPEERFPDQPKKADDKERSKVEFRK